jgi:predicted ArsR family transcriptional regulator
MVNQMSKTPKTQKSTKTEKQSKTQNAKLNFSTEQLITAVQSVGHPASSREISDKLGIKDPDQGRAYIRTKMASLKKEGKITYVKPADKSRCNHLYAVAEATKAPAQ